MRILRRLLVVVVVLVGLLVAVDRVGAYAASKATEREIRDQGAGSANVRILGFPFLTQVARGDLGAVTISERALSGNGLTFERINLTARGTHVSLSDAIRGRVSSVPVDHVDGTAVLTYASLSASILQALGVGSRFTLSLTAARAGDVEAHVTGPLGLSFSQQVPVPTVSAGRLQLGGFVQRFASVLPSSVAKDLAIGLPSLPYGLTLSSATAQSDGVHFAVTGRNVTLQ